MRLCQDLLASSFETTRYLSIKFASAAAAPAAAAAVPRSRVPEIQTQHNCCSAVPTSARQQLAQQRQAPPPLSCAPVAPDFRKPGVLMCPNGHAQLILRGTEACIVPCHDCTVPCTHTTVRMNVDCRVKVGSSSAEFWSSFTLTELPSVETKRAP